MFKVLNGENPQIVKKKIVSGKRPLMNFGKDHVFISLRLKSFSTVQKAYDSTVLKSGNLYQMILNAMKSRGFQNSNKEMETNIMPM